MLRHGYTVLLPDARAHGESGGALATYGLLERDDIRRWFEWLVTNQHPHCIFGLGESMGAAQLLQSLQTEPGFCAVVAESSFSNFQEIAYDRVGQFFNTGPSVGRTVLRPVVFTAFYYARWKYELNMRQVSPEEAIAQTIVPVLLIHGQIDSNIPVRHSRQIHSRNPRLNFVGSPQRGPLWRHQHGTAGIRNPNHQMVRVVAQVSQRPTTHDCFSAFPVPTLWIIRLPNATDFSAHARHPRTTIS